MKIREATIEDIKEIQSLHHLLLEFEKDEFADSLKDRWSYTKEGKNHLKDLINGEDCRTWLAEDNETIVGFLSGTFQGKRETRNVTVAQLTHIFIKDLYRGKGIGEKLFRLFKKWSKEKGSTEIDVGAYFENKKAIHFYEELGFKELGVTLIEKL